MLALKIFPLIILSNLIFGTAAVVHGKLDYVFQSCSGIAYLVNFNCLSSKTYWECQCGALPQLQSIVICVNEKMDHDISKVHNAYKLGIKYCKDYGHIELTKEFLDEQYINGSKYVIDSTEKGFNATLPHFTPVRFDPKVLGVEFRTYKAFYRQINLGEYYGGAMMGYWLLVIVIGSIANFFSILGPKLLFRLTGKPINIFRKYITLPPTSRSRHVNPLGYLMLVPLRRDTIILLGYLILNLVLTVIDYDLFLPNSFYSKKSVQLARYVADRSGIIAFVHFPALFLFAGRNNMFLWLTGWKYETFIIYHKWIARGMTIHAFIHAVGYTSFLLQQHYYKSDVKETYVRWGIVAITLCGLLMFQALYFFRAKCYEVFLALHIIFAALFMVGCWYHCITLGWMEYVYASIAIWAFDRFVRIVRMLWFGAFKNATYKLYDDDTIKLTIDRPKLWKPFPGAYVFLYVLHPRHFWQSHPFTIISSSDTNNKQISIVFKAKNGLTETIRNQISKRPDLCGKFPTLIEGPYGMRTNIDKYDSALLIVGGHGIPTGLCNAEDLSRRHQGNQRIVLLWIIPYIQQMLWVEEELERLNNGRVEIYIFVTRGLTPNKGFITTEDSNSSSIEEKSTEKDLKLSSDVSTKSLSFEGLQTKYPYINIIQGRPNIDELVVKEMKISAGSLGVISCGPGILSDSLRNTIANNLDKCNGRVDYFEETQVW